MANDVILRDCELQGLCGLKPFLCEGALRQRNTREFYSNNLRAVEPNQTHLYTSAEDNAERKTRQENKTGIKTR